MSLRRRPGSDGFEEGAQQPLHVRRVGEEEHVTLGEADTPNTYCSALTGLTSTLEPVGKVVFYPRPV